MKELLTKNFWRDVKRTFDEAREGSAPSSPKPQTSTNVSAPTEATGTVQAASVESRGILFDMDGVLYDAARSIAGAAETVRWVQSEGIPHLFVTNTSSRSRADLVRKLAEFGIAAVEPEIFTPTAAAADWLRTNAEGGVAAFVRPAARNELADLPLLAEDAERGAAYVVIGDLGDLWDYRTLNRAFRLLHHNPDAKLIALGMTRYWMAADGIALDVAPFVVALAHASRSAGVAAVAVADGIDQIAAPSHHRWIFSGRVQRHRRYRHTHLGKRRQGLLRLRFDVREANR